jgi:hypothetical protein
MAIQLLPSGNIGQWIYLLDMALNLYRRHRRDCEAGRSEDSRSGEFEERKKNWKRCTCRIFASGTLARRFKRRDTGRSTWKESQAVVAHWERVGSWDEEIPAPQPPPALDPNGKRITSSAPPRRSSLSSVRLQPSQPTKSTVSC